MTCKGTSGPDTAHQCNLSESNVQKEESGKEPPADVRKKGCGTYMIGDPNLTHQKAVVITKEKAPTQNCSSISHDSNDLKEEVSEKDAQEFPDLSVG